MGPEATLAPTLPPFVGAIFCCHERVIMSAIRAILLQKSFCTGDQKFCGL